jgi:hypothetical protein
MTTGVSRVEGGRVQALILPGSGKPEQRVTEPGPRAAPARDTPRQRAAQPSGLY